MRAGKQTDRHIVMREGGRECTRLESSGWMDGWKIYALPPTCDCLEHSLLRATGALAAAMLRFASANQGGEARGPPHCRLLLQPALAPSVHWWCGRGGGNSQPRIHQGAAMRASHSASSSSRFRAFFLHLKAVVDHQLNLPGQDAAWPEEKAEWPRTKHLWTFFPSLLQC